MQSRTKKTEAVKDAPQVVGERRTALLSSVQPNEWNPNAVPPHKMEAIKQSMLTDGWLESQPLLIWETDEKGRKKNIIIDGEHRWTCGTEVGFKQCPMVFLKGITKAQAQALTIKLDNNRGTFEAKQLSTLLKDLIPAMNVENPVALLGFTQIEVNKLLAMPAIDLEAGDTGETRKPPSIEGTTTSKNSVTKMVPIYMDEAGYKEFMDKVRVIVDKHKLETVTDAVVFAVKACKV